MTNYPNNNQHQARQTQLNGPAHTRTITAQPAPYGKEGDYSIASIQVEGEMIPFMVSASPTILHHALQQMRETGWLYLFNGSESLAIRSDKVEAVKLTRMTMEK